MLALLAAAVVLAGGYDDGRVLLTFDDRRIAESSGLVAGVRSDLLFTHNDSGDSARFFAVDRKGRTRATYELPGVQARDWEDMSRGPGASLWFGDIGDNRGTRDLGILVHRVDEPSVGTPTRLTPTTYRFRYDDGPRDAEALIVTPDRGRVLVVEKTLSSRAGVYASDLPLRPGGAVNVLHRVAEAAVSSVTGADVSPDGRRVALRNYTAAYEWDVPGGDVVRAFAGTPTRIPLPTSPQGEGISYDTHGGSLLTSSEGVRAPVHQLRRGTAESSGPSITPTARATGAPGSPRAAAGWSLPLATAGALLLCAALAVLLRRRR